MEEGQWLRPARTSDQVKPETRPGWGVGKVALQSCELTFLLAMLLCVLVSPATEPKFPEDLRVAWGTNDLFIYLFTLRWTYSARSLKDLKSKVEWFHQLHFWWTALAGKQCGSGTEIKFAHAEEIIHITGQEQGCETVLLHSTTKFSLRTDWVQFSSLLRAMRLLSPRLFPW